MNKVCSNNIKEMLAELQSFSSSNEGVTRLPFTPAAQAAAEYLKNAMQQAGLTAYIDAIGAVHGILPGKSSKRIIVGSHYDSVKNGGAYDGIAGVVCGIEIARQLYAAEQYYTLEIIAFNDEEGVRFGDGFFSSKAFLGEWTVERLKLVQDTAGKSIYEAMQEAGLKPEKIDTVRWQLDDIKCFMEIHIEQGAVLEQNGYEIGIVEGIVGMKRFQLNLLGQADHAGTTPMSMRHDALAAAAQVIATAEKSASQRHAAVATVGFCTVDPNTVNTVASSVKLSLDIRSCCQADIEAIEQEIMTVLQCETAKRGVSYEVIPTLSVEPAAMDDDLQTILLEGSQKLGCKIMQLNSGAGHDALPIARKIPAAMVFVPSRAGRSHCPEEYSSPESLAKAADIVLYTINKMNGEMLK